MNSPVFPCRHLAVFHMATALTRVAANCILLCPCFPPETEMALPTKPGRPYWRRILGQSPLNVQFFPQRGLDDTRAHSTPSTNRDRSPHP
ncbi:hypothetical protein CSC3H3_00775 [Thalassospira marina]|uniref:Secreted protein n=1 Tax=Thalassospira marina TaxID=2048283 RepID=A0ABM6Q4Q7_9PROT|nr:hypothetical protein CSC3H3_00775 [Thalassospira marina]